MVAAGQMGGCFIQEVKIWGKIFPDRDNNLTEKPGGAGQRDWGGGVEADKWETGRGQDN